MCADLFCVVAHRYALPRYLTLYTGLEKRFVAARIRIQTHASRIATGTKTDTASRNSENSLRRKS
jgi:hypothetical protein